VKSKALYFVDARSGVLLLPVGKNAGCYLDILMM